jgi:phage terminase large subunit-like protein
MGSKAAATVDARWFEEEDPIRDTFSQGMSLSVAHRELSFL